MTDLEEGNLVDSNPLKPPVELIVEYATDPLCCWSWAMAPEWKRLRQDYAGRIAWRYRMAAMVTDWRQYNDPVNMISRPGQMGPLMIQAGRMGGVPVDARVWIMDPPQSSIPACLAVKAAGLQSAALAGEMFERLQKSVMQEGRNISCHETLLAAAEEIAEICLSFDLKKFKKDMAGEEAEKALQEDVRALRLQGIERFPALTIIHRNGVCRTITGYHSLKNLKSFFEDLLHSGDDN